MGYFGLNSVYDSDEASDLAHNAINAMIKVLKKGLKVKANSVNTSGPENVGLFFEEFIVGNTNIIHDELYDLARDTSKALSQTIDLAKHASWDDPGNKQMHVKAYKRLKKKIDKFIENDPFYSEKHV